ncbi:sugar ABC transporter substrate-binding protein [Glaciihabitans arcticus]|uniref:Sugar ABC transporter substrate-binding protein n=1 Tax=Glaciihabitans arcticus TaxID=2668039 RepID=A0A4Q9GY57_9MICO|nr:sugar ABC transporter substrate-binding protein [Glaciihabitans arcticus]TBN57713.1 sugar ABC transporter substrate-binding protein [Glaciihabitans arcticus]
MNSSPQRSVPRRALTGITAAIGVSVLIAGCAAGPAGTTGGDYTPPDKDLKAEITYAFWDATQQDAIQANVDAFNEEYPNIDVNLDVTPWEGYWTKVQTQATSNTLPDLFWLNGPNFQLYASNDKIEPITSLVDGDYIDTANYPESLVDLYNLDGTQYGVPKDFDTIALWYNKDILAQAGVEEPTADWTWDDLAEAAETVSTKLEDKGIYGVAAGMDGQTTYYNTIFQAGGEVITADGVSGYDEAATQDGLQVWTDLIASGASPSIPQLTDTPADQWFTSGKVGMFYSGSWSRGAIGDSPVKDVVDVAPLPQGKEQATVIHGVSNVVAASSKNKQAAQALQAFLASEAAQKQQGDMGAVIPAFNGTQAAFAESYPGVNLQVFLDATEYAKPLPVSKNSAAWNALETKLLPDVFSGATKVADVSKDLAAQMTALLAKE